MRTGAKSGLKPYFYEYMFYRSIERTKQNIERATGQPGTIMVSQAKAFREEVEARLRAQGHSVTSANMPVEPMMAAIDGVLSERVPHYKPLFGDHTMDSLGYRQLERDFMNMVGQDYQDRESRQMVRARPGELGTRVPVSPYDPRFSSRYTVKKAGSELLFFPEETVDLMAGGEVSRLAGMRSDFLQLSRYDERRGQLVEAGGAFTEDDRSGMSELMGYMSQQEYDEVRDWVNRGGDSPTGLDRDRRFMSRAALSRSVALLQELQEQGTPYTVTKDRYPGQIKAQVSGTKIDIRLTDRAENERYVGRVYDDGAQIYFTTIPAPGNRGRQRSQSRQQEAGYVPTAQECVKLLRFAQGRSVERSDGKGEVGRRGLLEYSKWDGARGTRVPTQLNASYFSGSGHMAVVDSTKDGGYLMIRRNGQRRSSSAQYYGDTSQSTGAERAEAYLRDAVASARTNLESALDVESLMAQVAEHQDEIEAGTWAPEFHGDPNIASVQRSYWDVLTGRRTALLRPGATEAEYNSRVGMIGELVVDTEEERALSLAAITYAGAPADQVRDHAHDVIDTMVGSFDPRIVEDGSLKRFDPVGVSRYMTSEHGVWRNNDEIIAALRALDIDTDELMGSSFYNTTIKDRMIRFDETSATPIEQSESPFVVRMGEVIRASIERNACDVKSIMVDENGIVRYEATRTMSQAVGSGSRADRGEVIGEIGQLFVPGEYGEIVTKFNGGENYLFVPGYEALIVAQKPGESLTVEERTRLRGYEQIMRDRIEYQIGSDLLSSRTEIGEPTNLNGVYRQLYDVRHEVDFIERSREEGLSDDWRMAILGTEGRRVRYGNEIREGSTINAAWQAEQGRGSLDPSNDSFFDPYVLTGGRNMSILSEQGDGYFDPIMTSGSVNQGITRYLVEGARVNPDGSIVRGELDDRAPLMKHPDTALMAFDPFDRQQMTASNLMQAAAVTGPTPTAMMTFGGWNFDDGMVVSKRFAEQHQIRDVNGNMRTLMVGDKLSDLHGNKGVISLVVDPDMSDEEAEASWIKDPVDVFRANRELDVVMAPFSAVSRFNGGSAREMMSNPRDLHWGRELTENGLGEMDRGTVPAAIGDVRFIVTHMAADAKTRIYGEEDLAAGRGRKASSQLAWALNAHGADRVMAECYGTNNSSLANMRELLITVGLDMGPDGTLREGWQSHGDGDERRLIEMPELVTNAKGVLNWTGGMAPAFGAQIGDKGGDLELPFPLHFPSIDGTARRELDRTEAGTWKLPVMSSHLRSGQDLGDGTSTTHDYTNHYLGIQEQACRYRHAQQMLESGVELTAERREELQGVVASAQTSAQMSFDSIANDVIRKRFSGKYNSFKEQVMASRMPNSATAVWSADPRLRIDEIGMSTAMAESLDVQSGDSVLIWRDPMLRGAGVRYLQVAIDDRLTGVSINPVMDKGFDGDFDGDAVAVVKLNTRGAQLEARQKLSVQSNLLDLGQRVEVQRDGDILEVYPLMMHDALDAKVSQHYSPELKDRFVEMTIRANEIHEDLTAGDIGQEDAWEQRSELVDQLNDYYWEAVGKQYGDAVLTFQDAQGHLDSVRHSCIETGAKGSDEKLVAYSQYFGAPLDRETMRARDMGATQATREDLKGVQYATAVKSFGTGVAGACSQRGMKNLRNVCPEAVLELTYVVTQSVLQVKHNPEEARQKYDLLMGPVRELWRGRAMTEVKGQDGSSRWEVLRDEKGKEIQATTEDWKRQFVDLYTSKQGLNVSANPELVDQVAQALSVDGRMVNMESEDVSLASTMDKLAYGGDFDALGRAARREENLFEGRNNAQFAPFVVRNNIKAMEGFDPALAKLAAEAGLDVPSPEVTAIRHKDVLATNAGRAANKRSPFARTAGRPSAAEVVAVMDTDVAESSPDGYEM